MFFNICRDLQGVQTMQSLKGVVDTHLRSQRSMEAQVVQCQGTIESLKRTRQALQEQLAAFELSELWRSAEQRRPQLQAQSRIDMC